MTIQPFTSIELAVMQLLLDQLVTRARPGKPSVTLSDRPELVGGRFAYDPASMPWYIRIDKVPGGRSDGLEGDFVVDLEVFCNDYLLGESVAYDLEALALRYPHVVEVDGRKVVFDKVRQNVGVADFPWEDETVYRLGATYVITARRR